jgi:hypothetical protein
LQQGSIFFRTALELPQASNHTALKQKHEPLPGGDTTEG